MNASRAEWEQALRMAARLGSAPEEAVEGALEALADTRGPLTPGLVAFYVDLPERVLEELISQVRALAATPTTGTPPPAGASGLETLPARIDEFDLIQKLGEGGMGAVYRARERSLDREVALKLLSPRLASDPEAEQRFLREGRALAAVNDPHVVTCYRVGEDSGHAFIALELLRGGDAGQLAEKSGGRLPEARALRIARDCAAGLVALAKAGLVHRDVKPNNIFLTAEGGAKLGDLGLARSSSGADRVTLTGYAVGTPAFMSPEQLNGEIDLDERADVYSLGATLFHLLTGVVPKLAPQRVPDPREHVDGLSGPTVALVRRAMEPLPERRFSSARALHEALTAALRKLKRGGVGAGKRIGSTPRSLPASAPPRPVGPDRRPLYAMVAVAAILLGSGLALLGGGGGSDLASNPDGTSEGSPREGDSLGDPGDLGGERESTAKDAKDAKEEPEPDATSGGDEGDQAEATSAVSGAQPAGEPPGEREGEPADAEPPVRESGSEPPGDEPADAEASTSAAEPPADEPEPQPDSPEPQPDPPEPEPDPPEPDRTPPAPTPLAFDVGGATHTVSRQADGSYASRPGNADWSRAGLFDRGTRSLPLSVTWTCQARSFRDSTGGNLDHHGFQAGAGFFYELGLRASNERLTAGRELQNGVWWVSLQVQRSGRVLGMIRVINADKPGNADLTVVGGRTPGVDVVGTFSFDSRSQAFDVLVDFERRGWSLRVERGGRAVARRSGRWTSSRYAPIRGEFDRGAYLWGHLGNWSNGRGQGSLLTVLRPN